MSTWLNADKTIPLDMDGPIDVKFAHFDESWLEHSLLARFEMAATCHACHVAVSDDSVTLRYEELRQRAWTLAHHIDRLADAGKPVGILLPHDATFPVAALACLAAGRAYVPIDVKYPTARIAAIVSEGGLGGVVLRGDADEAQHLPADMPRIDIALADMQTINEAPLNISSCADDLAVILYTSGSTGKPKGIGNNQRAILQRVAEATNSCHIHASDRLLLLSSPGTIAGQREMFAALLNGASLHITDPQAMGVHAVLEMMQRERVSLCYAVPSLLRVLLRLPHAREAFAHMRVVRVGGDVTLASDLALFREVVPPSCKFFASFSATEIPAVFQWFVPPTWKTSGPRVPIGYARPGVDFMVLDENGHAARDGEIGELVVRSRYIAVGQWQEGRLAPGPFATDPDDPALRIFHTGDLVRRQAGGMWELFGRKDRLIKMRGLRIDVGEIETALRECDEVGDVAVIARRRGEETVALVAFVALTHDAQGTPDGTRRLLKQVLHERVPAYMHPVEIRVLDAIPQLSGFKPDMAALETLDRQAQERAENDTLSALAEQAMHAHDDVDDAVQYAWTHVLGAASCARNQSWEEANGDSLKGVELRFYLEDRLGFRLPFDILLDDTTPRSLAAAIRHARHAQGTQDTGQHAGESSDERNDTPLVFLFAAIQDDDPPLARFRMAFSEQVRFKLIDYPSWRETAAAGGSLASIVDAVVKKVYASQPCAVYRVAGYSFGGVIAFEVARRLLADGHRVDFLGLLDTRRWDLVDEPDPRFHRFLEEEPNWRLDWLKILVSTLVRRGQFNVLDAAERLLMRRPNRMALWLRRRITRELRYLALRQWQPQMLHVPTDLYLSDDRWPGEPEGYGWSEICQPLRLVPVGGDHATVIQSPQREKLCEAFRAALRVAPKAASMSAPTSARAA
jgi:amino acid adenylation domain-containing protein